MLRTRTVTLRLCYYTNTKTCLYKFEPLKPHLYIVKLGFPGVYIIFLISAQKHRLWVLGEAVLTSTHNLYFEHNYAKYHNFYQKIFSFLEVKFSTYLNRRVFVMQLFHAFLWNSQNYCPRCHGRLEALLLEAGGVGGGEAGAGGGAIVHQAVHDTEDNSLTIPPKQP